MKQNTDSSPFSPLPDMSDYDPIEDRLRASVRTTIETMFEEELAEFLGRLRYGRGEDRAKGYRHGHRDRQLTGTFGTETVRVPRISGKSKLAEAIRYAIARRADLRALPDRRFDRARLQHRRARH